MTHLSHSMREKLFVGTAMIGFGSIIVVSLELYADVPVLVFLPLTLVFAAIAAGVTAAACNGSRAAIICYFVLISFVTNAQFRPRGAGEVDADWQGVLKFGLWIGAGVVGFAHMPPIETMLRSPGSALWLLYILAAFVSSIYSPVPAYTFGYAFSLLCFFSFTFALTRNLTQSKMLWAFVHTLTVFNVISWIVFYQVPDLGVNATITLDGIFARMCGLAGQATNLGGICAMYLGAVFVLWWTGRCNWIYATIFGGLGLVTLWASDARTMMIAVVIGIAAVVLSRSLWALAGAALVVTVGFSISTAFPQIIDVLTTKMSRSGEAAEIYTLTGRMEIWSYAWEKVMEGPFLGWGYNSSKVILGQHVGFENGLLVDSAHNMYLQSLLSVGALGTLPLILLITYLVFKCMLKPSSMLVYFMILILIGSVSDTSAIGATPTVLTLLFMLISVSHIPDKQT